MRGRAALTRETLSMIRGHVVTSSLVMVIVAIAVMTVCLTSGRIAGGAGRVIETIDSAGTRSITVEGTESAVLRADAMQRIGMLDGVEWMAAFGPAFDVRNGGNPDGRRTPARRVYSADLTRLGVDDTFSGAGAVASASALDQLGMTAAAGSVTAVDGVSYPVVGSVTGSPPVLPEPILLLPQPVSAWHDEVAMVLVVVREPAVVQVVADAIPPLVDSEDPQSLRITTSADLARLRALVEGELARFGRALLLGVLGLGGALVAVLTFASVLIRRKDYGRRRALGASRGVIVGLLLRQTGLLSALGSVLGAGVAAVVLMAARDPLPGIGFFVALTLEAIAIGLLSAIPPAILASVRDPVRELRVP